MKTDVTDIPHHTAQQGPDNQPARPEKILPRMLMRRLSSRRAELANRYGWHTYQMICTRHFPMRLTRFGGHLILAEGPEEGVPGGTSIEVSG